MALAWNEIKDRALAFSRDWACAQSENSDAKPFWIEFFNVFGISSRRIGSFEQRIKKLDGRGYIDWLWKGNLLIEHKSRGYDLDRAYRQAIDYFPGLKEHELPRFVLVSDFARFRLYDMIEGTHSEFLLKELYKNVKLFWFIAGYQPQKISPQSPVNAKAVQRMARLHDRLKQIGYTGHALEVYLVRLLFCLFAEDTGIFERTQFTEFIEQQTREDGSDLAPQLAQLFDVLNTSESARLKNLDDTLARFPYINGKLFEERLPFASFDRDMRAAILYCCALDWSGISPAIFGSLFQNIMDETPNARRNLGAHYTTEENILKLIGPLFLDELRDEFDKIRHTVKSRTQNLQAFHAKLAGLKFLDPACGCGNFLVIAYRELRRLELEVLRALHHSGQQALDIATIIQVDVDQFHGIEIEEFPVQIAQVALWLTDHQMNALVSEEFGQYFIRLPLKKSAHIVHGNALRLDWNSVIAAEECNVVMGNPPFIGAKFMNSEQRADVDAIFHDTKNSGLLDYVACWYRKATDFIAAHPAIRVAFVSTNSITQGEQTGVLWPDLLRRGVHIHFAHRTFQWSSEASGKAAVHCVIIGFGLQEAAQKTIFEYENIQGEAHAVAAKNINPYLVDAPNIMLTSREKPICNVPVIGIGNKPIDGGNYLFTPEEKAEFIAREPQAAKWFRRWIGADEFLNGYERWCLWLGDCPPNELRKMPEAMKRVEAVRQSRLKSKSVPTQKIAATPTRFHVENIPDSPYLVIPEVSSERRLFVPIGFMQPDTLSSNLVKIVPNATLYHFGILTSTMHNAWMRTVCGRLESRYRYSVGIVYNNFPWPEPSDTQRQVIETAAQAVLDARAQFPTSTLADLYDPLTMPPELVRAHQTLDRAVDAAYGKKSFASEAERVAFLFERYQAITSLLPAASVKKTVKKHRSNRTMTRFLDGETRPVLTLPSRIGWQIYYSEILFCDPPCLFLQALPDFPGSNKPEAGQDVVWDVFSLIDSVKQPGAHQILTCTCGYAPDAGLEEFILVCYPDNDTVVWELDIAGLRPALDKTLIGNHEGYVGLVFAREQYETDIRALVRALQHAGRDPVPVSALDSRTRGLKYLLADYPVCDSLLVDELEPNTGGGMALERLLELDADERWPRTPLWPAGTLIEFGFFPGKSGHELMQVNGESFGYSWPGHYFTRWEVQTAFNAWMSCVCRAYALDSNFSLPASTVQLRKGAATHDDQKTKNGISPNDFVLLHAADRQRCHEAGRRFAVIFQASLQEGETATGVTVRYCENFLHAADDEPFPAKDDAGH